MPVVTVTEVDVQVLLDAPGCPFSSLLGEVFEFAFTAVF